MTDSAPDNPTESFRPALERLTLDVADMRESLLEGFHTRQELLWWAQRICVRTLGELPQRVFHGIARQVRLDGDERPALLAALLRDAAAAPDLSAHAAASLRERFYVSFVEPAFSRAFEKLRKDTGEYFDDPAGGPSGHDPRVQAYIAMRPAVNELEEYQQSALRRLLAGLDDTTAILEWGDAVKKATHGEISDEFLPRCHRERSTRALLLGRMRGAQPGRELFAATYLLPAFNAGVRDLAGRTGEQPADNSPSSGGTHL
jgi:hypothetical protein